MFIQPKKKKGVIMFMGVTDLIVKLEGGGGGGILLLVLNSRAVH